MNSIKIEARPDIRFMAELSWKTEVIISALRKIYGNNCSPKNSAIYKWITCFKRQDVSEDSKQIGRASASVSEE